MNLVYYPWHEKQWKQVINAYEFGRLPHALMFSGPEALAMKHFAVCLSAYLLCREKEKGHACGSCKSCILFSSANHPDMYYLEPEETGKQIKVDDVRGLIDSIQLSSQYAANKITLIYPAEAMNRNAANALLKTLEEPPPEVIFLLVTSQPARLPVTIRSRCQRINFTRADLNVGIDWLISTTSMNEKAALELLNLAEGRPLLALELSGSEARSNQYQVLSDLNLLSRSQSDIIDIARKWHDYGAVDVFRWLIGFLNRMARLKLNVIEDADSTTQVSQDLQQIVNQLHLYELMACYELAIQHYRALTGPFNLNPMGILEDFIIYWQSQINLLEDKR